MKCRRFETDRVKNREAREARDRLVKPLGLGSNYGREVLNASRQTRAAGKRCSGKHGSEQSPKSIV
jgi:hypothetical protein